MTYHSLLFNGMPDSPKSDRSCGSISWSWFLCLQCRASFRDRFKEDPSPLFIVTWSTFSGRRVTTLYLKVCLWFYEMLRQDLIFIFPTYWLDLLCLCQDLLFVLSLLLTPVSVVFTDYSLGVIAGAILFVLLLIGIVVAVIVVCCKRRMKAVKTEKEAEALNSA